MHYKQYAEHAETHAGGKLNESEIIRQWTEWETQLRQPGSTWPPKDSQGPKASPLRIWVKTKDVLKFQQMEMQQKQQSFTSGAPEKDVTEANILKGAGTVAEQSRNGRLRLFFSFMKHFSFSTERVPVCQISTSP